ncbi:MAG: sensor histidine kinase [Chloroflexota bacterium]
MPPGLLLILRQAAWLRGALIALGVALYVALYPGLGALPLLLAIAAERAAFIALVSWNVLRKKLGARFLPLALGWLFVMPVVEIALAVLSRDETLRVIGEQADVLGISSPLIWLVVPTVLAAWQYGRRGLFVALGILVVEHIALGIALWSGWQFGISFSLSAAGRIAMLALLGYVVMLLVEAQQREHRALEEANRQLAHRAATAEQLAESRERNRMARELHDILAHSLSALGIQLQMIAKLIDHDLDEAKAELREAQTVARNSANEVRRAIQQLRATPLADLGLSEALRELCRAQAERTGAQFDCQIADIAALDALTEQTVYRIAHEALANIERHAAATRVEMRLEIRDSRSLRLTIGDNGVGFDPRAISPGHFGLLGMAERARDAGGELRVESEMGKGTKVELEIGL